MDELALELARLRKEISKLGPKVNNYTGKQLAEYLAVKGNPQSTLDEINFLGFAYSNLHLVTNIENILHSHKLFLVELMNIITIIL